MTSRERALAAVEHRSVDRMPLMYRGLAETTAKLCAHLGLGPPDSDWPALLDALGADIFSAGSAMGRHTRLEPAYTGRRPEGHSGSHLDFVWGLVPQQASAATHDYVEWREHPMAQFTTVREIEDYPSPNLDDFDFSAMTVDADLQKRCIYSVGKLNHVFMIAARLRGMDQLLLDMACSPALAQALIDKVADFAVRLNHRSLEQAGSQADQYVLWDDIAMQNSMMMSPDHWATYLRPWYARLFADAKAAGLKVFYHCCGSFHPIIPALLDMGVDILDPVQTSARDMDLPTLKKRYGCNVCWHGGIDVQKLLPYGAVSDVRAAVREAEAIFGCDGGIVLGPSHEITPDTPIANILALYGLDAGRKSR